MTEIKDIIPNIRLSTTSLTLLNRLNSKELTLEQFLRECAYWALKDGFDELRPHPFPTPPNTQAFIEYEALPPDRQAKVDPNFFHKNSEIIDYYAQIKFICFRNKSILEWLIEIKSYITQEDELSHKKIEEKIFEFKAFLDDLTLQAEKVKEAFGGHQV